MQTWPRHSVEVQTVSEMRKKGDLCESERGTAANLLGLFPFFLTLIMVSKRQNIQLVAVHWQKMSC